jgi:hypothetical protein
MRIWLRLTGLFGAPDDTKSGHIVCTSIGSILRADADDLVHGPLPEQLTSLLRQIAHHEYELSGESQSEIARSDRPTASRANVGATGHVPVPSAAVPSTAL